MLDLSTHYNHPRHVQAAYAKLCAGECAGVRIDPDQYEDTIIAALVEYGRRRDKELT